MIDSSGAATPRERELVVLLAQRDELIGRLEARIVELEARLGQSPRNSSRPPSSEGYAKPPVKEGPKPGRGAQRRNPGKQRGTGGKHLAKVADPDEVVWHSPEGCAGCGGDLGDAEVVGESVRQSSTSPSRGCRWWSIGCCAVVAAAAMP